MLFATYVGIGALAHDTRFSLLWALASTLFVWAGPAQIILISTLGSGATVVQAALAVGVSAIRLFPMVVSVLPMLRTPDTPKRRLILPTHFIAVTLWVECYRLLPQVPRERRIAFVNGLGTGLVAQAMLATWVGYHLAANLPPLFGAAILLLTPLAFLLSTARNCKQLSDVVALVLGFGAVSAGFAAQHRRGYHDLRRLGRLHRLWCPLVATAMSDFIGDWHALAVLLLAGFLPNEVWRMLGLWLGGGVDEESGIAGVGEGGGDRDPRRRHRADPGLAARRAGHYPRRVALRRRRGRPCRFHGVEAIDLFGVASGELVMVAGKYWLG